MKLFEIVTNTGIGTDYYLDANETFPSMKAFIAHAKKPENGAKYTDREWILFPESKNSVPVKFKAVTQYTLDIEEKK